MDKKEYGKGLAYGASAFMLWGCLPLYWRLVGAIAPYQIFAQRVLWSFAFVVVILLVKKEWKAFTDILRQPKNWLRIAGPATFISINWLIYIWGVNNGYVIESSLGYYINPLVLTLFGTLFLKEKLTRLQAGGIVLSAIGVIIKTVSYGRVPWVALILATSFAIYGLLKKLSHFGSLKGLAFETLFAGLPSLVYLLLQETGGKGISGNLPGYYWLLIAISGVATATPLLLFAEGTKRLPLTVVGFLQYIAPTLALIFGIFVFREGFDRISLLAFAFVWAGVVVFSVAQYRLLKQQKE
ncbi:MAG: EamA family transporter RarD [Spirochaetes bacterium]|nr:EamA family transporter RarD [Spirochaetota bacterium]MBU0955094.1 EamA family transporter RarD [Spirochaetota bacterium]